MSYLPRMIYKAGKLSNKKSDYTIVRTLEELMERVEEGFLPLECESVEGMADIPELKVLVDRAERQNKLDARTADIVERVSRMIKEDDVTESIPEVEDIAPELDLEKLYEEESKKPAIWKGKETSKFKAWKKRRGV